MYTRTMPKLWEGTIQAHRREVRQAIMHGAAELAAEHGLLSLTMSHIAEQAGIGRATLYKYFSSVEDILRAWHDQQIEAHLGLLEQARQQAEDSGKQLEAVLTAYAGILQGTAGHGNELSAFLHSDDQVARARARLRAMIVELIETGIEAGRLRADVPAGELAEFCLSALNASRRLPSQAAARRLAAVVLAGLRPEALDR
jgi:AcrR family transcriptional regulator